MLPDKCTTIEENKRLSDSIIWKMVQQFYDRASLTAWNEVPFYPTSSTYIAETYAELILAFLRDYYRHLQFDDPLYIVEMGAGTGCFSFYLLRELQKKIGYFRNLKRLRLRYIMTDGGQHVVHSWSKIDKLRPFVDEGVLSFGLFRPDEDMQIVSPPQATAGGQPAVLLSNGQSTNPVIAIANYFFDSLKQDAYQIQDRSLKEVRHSFFCAGPYAESQVDFNRWHRTESYEPVSVDYYDDPQLNRILKKYCKRFDNASFLFPLGAFNCVRNLRNISNDNLLLLSADTGVTDESRLEGRHEQPFSVQGSGGTFAYRVNYDALRKLFEELGGTSLNTQDNSLSVCTAANYLLKYRDVALEESRYYFRERVDKQNPANYLFFLQDLFERVELAGSKESLRACLGYIQLCNFDPHAFCVVAPIILFALEAITPSLEVQLLTVVKRVQDNFYSIQQRCDVFYWAARLYSGLGRMSQARQSFADSLAVFGESSASLYYLADCYEQQQAYAAALDHYQQALRLEPDCKDTQAAIERVSAYMINAR